MFNRLHACLNRPERDLSPVPASHAASDGELEWGRSHAALLDEREARIGGLADKTVLDFGGGPGHCSLAMVRGSTEASWHDVSRGYVANAYAGAAQAGLEGQIEFSLGDLEEAPERLGRRFDFVFNRICWYYGLSDRSFAKVLTSLVEPGGFIDADTTHSGYRRGELDNSARLHTRLGDACARKIGHPYPSHDRLTRLFPQHEPARLEVDYPTPTNYRLLLQMPGRPGCRHQREQ
jgi:hypothetical protein